MKKITFIILISFVLIFNNFKNQVSAQQLPDNNLIANYNEKLNNRTDESKNYSNDTIINLDTHPNSENIAKIPSRLYFIDVSGGMSELNNKDIKSSGLWQTKSNFGYQADIGLSWFIKSTKKRKIQAFWGFALGISLCTGTISFSNYNAVYTQNSKGSPTKDPDRGDEQAFINNVSYNSVNEKTNIMMAEIPVFIEFGRKNHKHASYFLKLGLAPSVPVSSTFTGGGTYSNTGTYNFNNSKYNFNYTLEDLPQYGFYTNKSIYHNTPTSTLSSFDLNGLASIGILLPWGTKSYLKLGINGELGLMQLAKNNNYDYSTYKYQFNVNNILEDNKAGTFNSFIGISIGYVYNFGGWLNKKL